VLIPASLTPPSTTPTPADNRLILADIQPAELRWNKATLSLARRAMEPGHLLHSVLTRLSSANARRLKSRHPLVPAVQRLISISDKNIRAAQWADYQWNAEWTDNPTSLRTFILDTGTHTRGMTLPRRDWFGALVRVGRFRSCLHKWGMASSAPCECGAEEQTVDHVVLQHPTYRPPHGLQGLTVLDDVITEWLLNTCPEI